MSSAEKVFDLLAMGIGHIPFHEMILVDLIGKAELPKWRGVRLFIRLERGFL